MKRLIFCSLLALLLIPNPVMAQETPLNDNTFEDRIVVTLDVETLDSNRLELQVDFYNPYRSDWVGDIFLERESPLGQIFTIARAYQVTIQGGEHFAGNVIIPRPSTADYTMANEPPVHLFVARAYHRDGGDRKLFINRQAGTNTGILAFPQGLTEQPIFGANALDITMENKGAGNSANLHDRPFFDERSAMIRQPISVRLSLRKSPRDISAVTAWRNAMNRSWRGDLYVDVTTPDNTVVILRRDLDRGISPGLGFRTLDRMPSPNRPGIYRFNSRALQRDGSAETRWVEEPAMATTEIIGVCKQLLCEMIEPEQQVARLVFTGKSSIHLESDIFSERRPTVEIHYDTWEFDITDLCHIHQFPSSSHPGTNHITVEFDSFELPIGPRTWAYYQIELYPMPTVPPDAKLADGIWVLTNGAE